MDFFFQKIEPLYFHWNNHTKFLNSEVYRSQVFTSILSYEFGLKFQIRDFNSMAYFSMLANSSALTPS